MKFLTEKILPGFFTILLILAISSCGCRIKETRYLLMGTGAVTGNYYPNGIALARIVNEKKNSGIYLVSEASRGSIQNIKSVISGEKQLGIVQSDVLYEAYNGIRSWQDVPGGESLRGIASLYTETVTLITRAGTGIESLADLKGLRISIGPPGSGTRENAIRLLELYRMSDDGTTILLNDEVKSSIIKLKLGQIDALFYTVGHPSNLIESSFSESEQFKFCSITVPDEFMEEYPFYTRSEIDPELYANAENSEAVASIGVTAVLTASEELPSDVVQKLVREMMSSNSYFISGSRNLMLSGLPVPAHSGVMDYFRENS